MPEFIADTDGTVDGKDWSDLDAFTQGYIECILFTETASGISMVDWFDPEVMEDVEEGRADGNIPEDTGFSDLHPDSLEKIIADCARFQSDNAALLAEAYGHHFPARTIGDGSLPDSRREAWDYDAAAAGRDFWFTRCGHGVGFWDRGLGDVGDKLSADCKAWGDAHAWFGDVVGFDRDASPTGYGWFYVE